MRRLSSFFFAALVALAACGTDDNAPTVPEPAEVCATYASAMCDKMASCAPFYIDATFPSGAACVERTAADCEESLNLTGVDLTGVDVDACVSGLNGLSCEDVLDGGLPEACVVEGTLGVGEACRDDAQCSTANCYSEDADCGTCQPRALALGDDCAQTECPGGMFCNEANQCAALAALGETCDEATPCTALAGCVYATDTDTTGTCTAPAGLGEACASSVGAPGCAFFEGEYCHPVDAVCTELTWASLGETCGYDVTTAVYTVCGADTFCDLGEDFSGTCVAKRSAGEACEAEECAWGLRCDNGTCVDDAVSCE